MKSSALFYWKREKQAKVSRAEERVSRFRSLLPSWLIPVGNRPLNNKLHSLKFVLPKPHCTSILASLCFSFLPFFFVFQRYRQLYDLSRSERSKVHELAVTMATDGQPLDCIKELLRVAVGPLDLSVKTVLRDAMERVVAALRYCLSPFLHTIHMCTKNFLLRKYTVTTR